MNGSRGNRKGAARFDPRGAPVARDGDGEVLNTNVQPGLRERLSATLLADARGPTPFVLTIAGALTMLLALPPNSCGLLAGVAMVPLLIAIVSATTMRRAFLCGWLFGTLLVALAIAWLEPAVQRFGEFPSWLSWALFALVVSQSGLTLGVFAALLIRVRRRFPVLPMAMLAPILLTTAEFIVPRPFDWNIGVTLASHPWITQVADITGIIGLSFLIAMVNGALFDAFAAKLRRRALPWWSLACTLTMIAASLAYSQYRIADIDSRRSLAPALRIGAVQGNISLSDGSDPDLAPRLLERYLRKSQQLVRRGAELVIWPETAFPYLHVMTPGAAQTEVTRVMRELGVPLLVGMVSEGSATPGTDFDLYNSVYLIAANGHIQGRYDKHRLFPVREYIPLGDYFPFLNEWFSPRYTAGAQRTVLPLGPHRIGPMICYEDIQPGFVRDLAPLRPNLLVTLSNDSWFGADAAPQQHMALAVFRSIEMRLDMVRVSTNGVTAIIDAAGRVTVQTRAVDPETLPGVKAFGLIGTVAMLDGGHSFYARFGPIFAWLNLLAALALLVVPVVSRSTSSTPTASV